MTVATPIRFAPDAAVPYRDELLEVNALGERIAAATGHAIDHVERIGAKYRIGESLRVVARVELAQHTSLMACRTFGAEGLAAERLRSEGLPGVFVDDEARAIFWTLPADRRLRDLERLLNRPNTLIPAIDERWVASRIAAWSPESCLTVACLDIDGVEIAYVKAYRTAADVIRVATRHTAIALLAGGRMGGPRVPKLIAWSEEHRVVAVSRLEGVIPTGVVGAQALGRALGALHSVPAPPLGAFGRLRPERLRRSTEFVSAALPETTQAAARACRDLSAGPGPGVRRDVLLHGDVHPANIRFANGEVGLLDLDQAGIGPPECDLGSALARIERDRILSRVSDRDSQALRQCLIGAYGEVAPLPDARSLRWHVAACLVAEGALRAVNKVQDDVLPFTQQLLEAASETIRGERD